MLKTCLGSGWRFIDFAPGEGDAADMSTPGADNSSWGDIAFPGDVNAALVRDGRMPDPHFGVNGRRCHWVTAREWWARKEFTLPATADCAVAELLLDGVDGNAEAFLNGETLGRMENAFRPHRFDIGDRLRRDGPNVLLIRFRAIDEIMGGPRETDSGEAWDQRRTRMRKPQFSFGWDWALSLPSIGVMGGVWLERHSGPRLLDVSAQALICGRVDFKLRVNTAARDAGYALIVRLKGHGVDQEKRIERSDRCFSHTSMLVDDPALWWPRGMGAQPLYDYSVELQVDGETVERRSARIGFRETRILEEPFTEEAGPGISFWVTVNGRRVFCKGGNWVPLEHWPAVATDEQYRFHVEKAAEANFNMLRVWGGGLYERDIFYDLCDELGVMVWQDFMFASMGVPLDDLRDEIIAEAQYQIKRLRERPCIVLWCGMNEDIFSWHLPEEIEALATKADATADASGIRADHPSLVRSRLRDDPELLWMILRGLVSKLGFGVPYVESSPQSWEDNGNLPESGNGHVSCRKYLRKVGIESGVRFREHFDVVQSFDSEFGLHGPSCEATMRSFLSEGSLWPPDDVWEYQIQYGFHWETIKLAGGMFGPINSLEEYVKHGQAAHAEMMRAEFESARRDRPNNGGTMMWMYNDCRPTANWSIIDYYGRPKPAYYAARRACAELLPIILERRGRVEFFFSNDGPQRRDAAIRFGQARLDGSLVWERSIEGGAEGMDTTRFYSVERDALNVTPNDYLFIRAEVDGEALPWVTYFLDGWKGIEWPEPNVSVAMLRQTGDAKACESLLEVRADAYARFCHLLIPEAAGVSWVDDNFFDLPAGSTHTVKVRSADPFAVEDVTVGNWHTRWP